MTIVALLSLQERYQCYIVTKEGRLWFIDLIYSATVYHSGCNRLDINTGIDITSCCPYFPTGCWNCTDGLSFVFVLNSTDARLKNVECSHKK